MFSNNYKFLDIVKIMKTTEHIESYSLKTGIFRVILYSTVDNHIIIASFNNLRIYKIYKEIRRILLEHQGCKEQP